MPFVFPSLGDPLTECRLIFCDQWHRVIWGGHLFVRVRGENPRNQFGSFRFAGNDRDNAALASRCRPLCSVEPELGLARVRVGAVAIEAAIGQDRSNIAVVIKLRHGWRGQNDGKNKENRKAMHDG